MIKQYGLVQTLINKGNAPAGTYGVVVEIFSPPSEINGEYYVELWDQYNYPFDDGIYRENELRALTTQEEKELLAKTDIKKILEMHG
ncbi:MAG: hypothetical protein IJ247_01415 [Bacilli bacterium]|nr:hypothetical protein [Bacilli bacterium]